MPFDPESAAFLRFLQDDLFGPSGENPDWADREGARRVIAALPEDQRRGATELARSMLGTEVPSPHEAGPGYSILSELAADILAVTAEDFTLPNPPLVGTLPLRWPTAGLLRVPDSTKHLAVVDVQFTTFANLLAKACAQALVPLAECSSDED